MIRTEFGRTAAKIFGHRTDFGHTFPESGTTNIDCEANKRKYCDENTVRAPEQ